MGKQDADGHKKDKKHKRHASDAHAAQGPAKKCKVEVQPPSTEVTPAVACYFPAGPAPQGASYTLFESGSSNRPSYTLLGNKHKVTFVGTSQGEEYVGLQASVCSQALGVYNKSTGTLQLLPLAGGRVLRMEPRLPGLNYEHIESEAPADEGPETREQLLAENKRLVAQFGSTRRRRQLQAKEEGVVRADKLGDSGDALAQLLANVADKAQQEGLTKQQVLASANEQRFLPPHNLDANTAEQAYPLDSVMPPEVAHHLKTHLLMKAATDGDALMQLSEMKSMNNPYVLNRVSILRDPDMNVVKRRAKLLSYLTVLMRLRSGRPTLLADNMDGGLGEGMASLAKNLGTTSDVLRPLLDKFYTPGDAAEGQLRFVRSKSQEALLTLYICVVALLAEPGHSVPAQHIQEMADTLKMSLSDLVDKFRAVGAVCKSVTLKQEGAGTQRLWSATLMPDNNKKLRDCLPAIKLLPKAKK